MPDTGAVPVKMCVVCGRDVADKPRVKDAAGRYMCKPCAEKQTAAKPATTVRPASGPPSGTGGGAKTAAKPVTKSADNGAIPLAPEPGYDPVMASLVASSQQVTSVSCPNCKSWVKEGQLLCTSCGFNLEEGKQIRTRVQKEKAPKEAKVHSGGGGIPDAMAPVVWIVGAAVGGAAGAGLWYGVAIATEYEIGWIAWIVGILTGLGATIAARDTAGMGSGLVACVAAILAICAGRYFAVSSILTKLGLGGVPFEEWFFHTLSPIDGLFAALALVSAWKVGSSGVLGDDD